MAAFDEHIDARELSGVEQEAFLRKVFMDIAGSETNEDLGRNFNMGRAYLIGLIHAGYDLKSAASFENGITAACTLRNKELVAQLNGISLGELIARQSTSQE